jgi:hypothetical protein
MITIDVCDPDILWEASARNVLSTVRFRVHPRTNLSRLPLRIHVEHRKRSLQRVMSDLNPLADAPHC